MARSGDGTFSISTPIATANAIASSSTVNAGITEICTGLTDSINKDGTKAFAANQPMGGYKLTSLGDGTAAADSANLKQVQIGTVSHAATVSGTVDAITAAFSPALTAYATNMYIRYTSAGSNTSTTPTINCDGLGAKTIVKAAGAVLAAGDLGASGTVHELVYNGTNFVLLNPVPSNNSLASTTDVLTGTSAAAGASPDAIAALWEAGSDIADNAAITIGEGGYFNLITSTTAITSFVITTNKAGRTFRCRFNTSRILTHNATSLILPGGANIVTQQGDIAQFRSLGSGNVVCEWYTRAATPPPQGPTVLLASTSVGTGTSYTISSSTIAQPYRKLTLVARALSHDSGSAQSFSIELSGDNGSNWGTAITMAPAAGGASGIYAHVEIFNASVTSGDRIVSIISNGASAYVFSDLANSVTQGYINAIRIKPSGGNFDGGTVALIGEI